MAVCHTPGGDRDVARIVEAGGILQLRCDLALVASVLCFAAIDDDAEFARLRVVDLQRLLVDRKNLAYMRCEAFTHRAGHAVVHAFDDDLERQAEVVLVGEIAARRVCRCRVTEMHATFSVAPLIDAGVCHAGDQYQCCCAASKASLSVHSSLTHCWKRSRKAASFS